MLKSLKSRRFLFEELVKRDFKQKYKRTILGMVWSVLSPLLMLFVMRLVFTRFFGRDIPNYTTYLFAGNIVYNFYSESTVNGMGALLGNADIFSKVNVPKYMFLLSKNISSLLNFVLTLLVFFVFVALDGISFSVRFIMLLYPIVCLIGFNMGVGLILSALLVFFRDIKYLYEVFLRLLMYLSAIFYDVNHYPPVIQRLFLLNPVYCYIKYFRIIVIDGSTPSLAYHLLCALYPIVVFAIGGFIYKKYNHKFLYYI